jgi:ABC-2 type transport system permease protein
MSATVTEPGSTPSTIPHARLLYWSVRRELWENRSILYAPLIAAGVVMFGFLISTRSLPSHMRDILALDPSLQGDALAKPYGIAMLPILVTMLITAAAYCLGALYNERRDRSILFWKSLPVPDLVTVLAKACIPLVILPLVTFAIILATQWAMLLLSSLVLMGSGVGASALWLQLPFVQMWVIFLYSLAAISLWFAPLYLWLLLVSGWAKRTPFLWALSPLALCVVELLAFHTAHLFHLLAYRVHGVASVAYAGDGPGLIDHLSQLDPVKFLTSAGLWAGLAAAAALLAAAVWMRRRREPI